MITMRFRESDYTAIKNKAEKANMNFTEFVTAAALYKRSFGCVERTESHRQKYQSANNALQYGQNCMSRFAGVKTALCRGACHAQ